MGAVKFSNSKSDLQGYSRAGADELSIGGSRAEAAESKILGVKMHSKCMGRNRAWHARGGPLVPQCSGIGMAWKVTYSLTVIKIASVIISITSVVSSNGFQ